MQILARDPKLVGRQSNADSDGGDIATRTFFESLFRFADKSGKGELVVEDLETLFQVRNAFLRPVLSSGNASSVVILLTRLPSALS